MLLFQNQILWETVLEIVYLLLELLLVLFCITMTIQLSVMWEIAVG